MQNKINLKRILLFYLIAIIFSNLFRFDVFDLNQKFSNLPGIISIFLRVLLEGSGIFMGGIIGLQLLRNRAQKEVSILGSLGYLNFIMLIVMFFITSLIGIENQFGINKHLYGLLAILVTLIYCFMEEYGWRGYLQNELNGLKSNHKYLIIGLLWYLWHLSFLTNSSFQDNLFFLGIMIFGSWGIGQVMDTTKSILASSCFHLIFQIMISNSLIKNGISLSMRFLILVVCFSLWMLIIKGWESKQSILK
jgi:uncharacterized protein